MPSRLYAVLVGIDAYPPPIPRLAGCVNDVTAFAETLKGRTPAGTLELTMLTDGAATRAAVVEAISTQLGRASADDTALLYYSGHGSQQACPPELWAGEPDHRNETIVLVDSRQPGCWDLADKELATLLTGVAASGCHLLVVLDCCHSGGGTRDVEEDVRLAPEDPRRRPVGSFLPGVADAATGGPAPGAVRGLTARWGGPVGRHVLLAACRADEKAKEVTVLGAHRGALSAALETALRETDGLPTYRDVLRIVSAGVQRRVVEQHPQLEAVDPDELDEPFLGGAVSRTARLLTLSHLPDGWSIDAGAVHGVPEPIGDDTTELAVYPLTSETTGAPLATGAVTRVLPDRCLVALSRPLDEDYVYRAVVTSIPLQPLAVAVLGDEAGTATLRDAAGAADSTLIALVDDPTGADLLVEARPEGFVITRPGVTRPLVPTVAGTGRESRVVAALEHVARWVRLSGLHNPATRLPAGALRLTVTTPGGPAPPGSLVELSYAGENTPSFTLTITNTTDQTLWGALLDLTETYGVFTDAFPSGSVALGPGESTSVSLSGEVSDALWAAGTVAVTDQLKLVTSTLEFDPRSLQQDELDVRAVGSQTVLRGGTPPRSTLERLLTRATTRRLAPAQEEAVADWRTDEVLVRTARPPVT
ncbi:peptidase C14 caspase catalytic subunit p20 [Intrasporangium oryzae NRRL B-24470]|uniref:Peptidase C14 caspase catalytic subunit p20 n=1 Tax=Intrasporangium oryzae NRRL B-24470 TaxID=1386089 RepID=W9GAQ9_9MICO|nr:caspase family protein [Intrasporangium oryzae]EWT03135.1 peptidase C14 caspase catalytic subunit p20 [Intrasporangium oryzae NRRL B-24470]